MDFTVLTAVDWAFVGKKEGKQQLNGYVICAKKNYLGTEPWSEAAYGSFNTAKAGFAKAEESGVTIATGFDIGQYTTGEIKKLPISEGLKVKLLPFCAKGHGRPLKGKEAADKLFEKKGLTITTDEANTLDYAVPNKILNDLVALYEPARKKAGGPLPFISLPVDIRTAIYSFAFQYGPAWYTDKGKGRDSKKFWEAIVAQNWGEAVKVLLSYKVQHVERRHAEARKIKLGMASLSPAEPNPRPS